MAITNASGSTLVKLSLMLGISVLLALCVGAYALSIKEIFAILTNGFHRNLTNESSYYLILNIRLPRILLAVLVGMGLAVSGAAIQVVFRNPLADPSLIGVSSGAMFFAASFIVCKSYLPFELNDFGNYIGLSVCAFVGGLLATMMVYRLSTEHGKTYISTMLLAGVAITALAGGLTGLLIFYANESQLRDITFWNLGSISGANWQLVGLLMLVITIGVYTILKNAKELEIMQLGDQEAAYLGVRVEQTKRRIILVVVFIVGTCVAFTGMIGFVGLVVPHLVRIYCKNTSFSSTMLYTAFVGAILLVLADTIARTIVNPAELPIGILTALIGAPFFLWLLVQNKNKY